MSRSCANRTLRLPAWLAVAALVIVGWALVRATPAAALRAHDVPRLTLARLDPCFYAPSPAAWWPVAPRQTPHEIRAGFNDPHGEDPMYFHWGVDVSTSTNDARVYAMTSGRLTGVRLTGPNAKFAIGPFFYYHVVASVVPAGSYVTRGQLVGHILHDARHVHVAEWEPVCGLVDPRRPTGPFHDPMNTEHPVVRDLTADVANRAAYRPFPCWHTPDPSTPLSLRHLHGRVDLRAEIYDMPVRKTTFWPQQPLMPSGVQAWLAPPKRRFRRFSRLITVFDGAHWHNGDFYAVMAHGTVRNRSCFKDPRRPCENRFIFHVARSGLDTRNFPDGSYRYCVSAITINGRRTTTCWAVRIENHPRRKPTG